MVEHLLLVVGHVWRDVAGDHVHDAVEVGRLDVGDVLVDVLDLLGVSGTYLAPGALVLVVDGLDGVTLLEQAHLALQAGLGEAHDVRDASLQQVPLDSLLLVRIVVNSAQGTLHGSTLSPPTFRTLSKYRTRKPESRSSYY